MNKIGFGQKKWLLIFNYFAFSILIFFSIFQLGCEQKKQSENKGNPKIQFDEKEFDFGNITMGEKVSHRFVFKNIGSGDLLIDNVIGSCGCTVFKFDKSPILAGGDSFIEVEFNSDGYRGLQKKDVEVYSNCDSSKTVLTLWASIIQSEQ